MRVLFAVDGSEGSFGAIEQVSPLLRADRDEIVLYCSPPQVGTLSGKLTQDVASRMREALAETIFTESRTRFADNLRAKISTIVGHKDPRRGILVAAQQCTAGLIVMGARGLGLFERLLLGSVSRAVLHGSDIPVWVARPKATQANQPLRVLMASESPEAARRPAQLLERLAWPEGTDFAVVTVIYSILAGQVPGWLEDQARSPDVEDMVKRWAREHDQELRESVEQMKEFVGTLSPPLRNARALVKEGDPSHMILSLANQEKSDLVVVGTRQKWSIGSAVLGRVSEAVVNHAGCSVLVVPHVESP